MMLQYPRCNMTNFAAKGSRRWLQIAVTYHPELLLEPLFVPLGLSLGERISWVSPLASERFREYFDSAALGKVGIRSPLKRPLRNFWPAHGPVWDALGIAGSDISVFVEANAHIPEMASSSTRAKGAARRLIETSLTEARSHYAPKATAEWSGLFYQYANRLAHHYFLSVVNGLPSHLVFVYFLNDKEMKGPSSKEEWKGAVRLLHAALGLPADLSRHGVHEVFIDVNRLKTE